MSGLDLRIRTYKVYKEGVKGEHLYRVWQGYARSGHDAIESCLKSYKEEGYPLATCDLVAVPDWAAHQAHHVRKKQKK